MHTIKERKIPLFLMILLFTVLGNILLRTAIFRDFGMLFYGTSFGLIIIYLFSIFNIKMSLHLLSMGSHGWFFYDDGHGILDAPSAHTTSTHPVFWTFGKF